MKYSAARWITIFVCLLLEHTIAAQLTENKLKSLLSNSSKPVKLFYEMTGYRTGWTCNEDAENLSALRESVSTAAEMGLREADYRLKCFETFNPTSPDSLEQDICFTEVAIHFLNDISVGSHPVKLSYNGIGYTPEVTGLPELLVNAVRNKNFRKLVSRLEPRDTAYESVKEKLKRFTAVAAGKNFKDAVISSPEISLRNKGLIARLVQLGLAGPVTDSMNGKAIMAAIKNGQDLFNLPVDGILKTACITEFNVPLQRRITELSEALKSLRWLSQVRQQGALIVNIPSANLLLYQEGSVILESRIIPGKPATPTPTLASKISNIIIYPYWNVPKKIARLELLPMIKKNRGYLSANNFQVLDKTGKVINPQHINWTALTATNFPYTLRQSTGCDNSLGLIKLDFYNPYDVYLHDTPWKMLFGFKKRYFSHGCMRLEKAKAVAHYLLQENSIAVDTVDEKHCLKNQAPLAVPAVKKIPVIVMYNTAWVDGKGTVRFFGDVYRRFAEKK